MAIKACLPLVRVVAHKPLHLFPGVVVVARLSPIGEKRHGAPAVWLNAKRTYPICPILRRRYLASLSLSKSKQGQVNRQRKGGRCLWLSQTLNERTARIRRERKRSRISSSMPQAIRLFGYVLWQRYLVMPLKFVLFPVPIIRTYLTQNPAL